MGIVPTSTSVCYPSSPTAKIGDPCERLSDCGPNTGCYNNIAWYPGGVCIGENCNRDDPNACPSGTVCALLRNQSFCQPACNAAGGCDRPGYVCNEGIVCQEAVPRRDVGEPCSVNSDCGGVGSGMVCLRDGARPGGYCTKLDCLEIPACNVYYCLSPEFQCPPFSRCLPLTSSTTPARSYCARECTEGRSCYGTTMCDAMLNVCL